MIEATAPSEALASDHEKTRRLASWISARAAAGDLPTPWAVMGQADDSAAITIEVARREPDRILVDLSPREAGNNEGAAHKKSPPVGHYFG